MMCLPIRRAGWKAGWSTVIVVGLFTLPAAAQEQSGEQAAGQGRSPASAASREKESPPPPRGRLAPFYDVSFHSVRDNPAVVLSDYVIDDRFWERRPTIVVVTPISPNVLQPDEAHAEALTEALLRQIAADLGVRDVQGTVSQAIGALKKLGKSAMKRQSPPEPKTQQEIEQAAAEAKPDRAAENHQQNAESADERGLRTVQLLLIPDVRPVWTSMSLFDRAAVEERSLNEYLKKVPAKRDRLLEYLDADQFRFSAFPGKEAGGQLMEILGLRRPELHFLVVDQAGKVVGMWNKFTFDAKQISAAYRKLSKTP